jgi:hypothetical protein
MLSFSLYNSIHLQINIETQERSSDIFAARISKQEQRGVSLVILALNIDKKNIIFKKNVLSHD